MRRFAPLALLLTMSAQPAPEPQVDWRWERDTPVCSLRQVFAADGSTIQISRTAGSEGTSIRIGGYEGMLPTRTSRENDFLDGVILLEPGQPMDAHIWTVSDNGRRDISAGVDSDILTRFAKTFAVEISHEKIGKVRAPVRSAAAAAEALRRCEDSKLREWEIDPVSWHALKTKPSPTRPPASWLSADDYPATSIINGVQGFVIARFEIAADGTVLECRAIRRNRSIHHKDRLCPKLKQRVRFRPALDANGNPVAAPYVMVIQFRLA